MDFGKALAALKSGKRVHRTGWNGKGLFLYLVPAASYPVQTGAAKEYFGAGGMVPYNPYLAVKNPDNTVSTWAPSIGDCLATDWEVHGVSVIAPHQQRVLDEQIDVATKLTALSAFILDNPIFLKLEDAEQRRLQRQRAAMELYSAVLDERVAAFTEVSA